MDRYSDFLLYVMHPDDAHRMANRIDTDQTAPEEVSCGSTLFAQTCLFRIITVNLFLILPSNYCAVINVCVLHGSEFCTVTAIPFTCSLVLWV